MASADQLLVDVITRSDSLPSSPAIVRRPFRPSRESLGSSSSRSDSPAPRPPPGPYDWLVRILNTGESVSALSLSGNHAVALTKDKVGTLIEYTVRQKVERKLVSLTPCFKYRVMGVFGNARGRAILVQPEHAPNTMILAFRGVRNREAQFPEIDAAGPAHDRTAFKETHAVPAAWLPEAEMRVHSGVLSHHESLWNDGLSVWIRTKLATAQSAALPCTILLVGLSFGGALAELTASRIALEYPSLTPTINVLSFGSIPWAGESLVSWYDKTFGRRSVQLVLSRRDPGPPPEGASWWVPDIDPGEEVEEEAGEADEADARDGAILGKLASAREAGAAGASGADAAGSALGGGGVDGLGALAGPEAGTAAAAEAETGMGAEEEEEEEEFDVPGFVVFDPLVATPSPEFRLLENTLACNQDEGMIDGAATSRMFATRVEKSLLADFIDRRLDADHPLMVDYNQLHYGARYRDVLIKLLLRHREMKAARLEEERVESELAAARLAEAASQAAAARAASAAATSAAEHGKLGSPLAPRGEMKFMQRRGFGTEAPDRPHAFVRAGSGGFRPSPLAGGGSSSSGSSSAAWLQQPFGALRVAVPAEEEAPSEAPAAEPAAVPAAEPVAEPAADPLAAYLAVDAAASAADSTAAGTAAGSQSTALPRPAAGADAARPYSGRSRSLDSAEPALAATSHPSPLLAGMRRAGAAAAGPSPNIQRAGGGANFSPSILRTGIRRQNSGLRPGAVGFVEVGSPGPGSMPDSPNRSPGSRRRSLTGHLRSPGPLRRSSTSGACVGGWSSTETSPDANSSARSSNSGANLAVAVVGEVEPRSTKADMLIDELDDNLFGMF